MNIATLTEFFGWCTIVNLVFYTVTAGALMLFKGLVSTMSARMFGIDQDTARRVSFAYLANYKLAFIVFSLVPYVALKLMT